MNDVRVGDATGRSLRQLLQLKRWNTPTIYNGWEQIAALDAAPHLEPTLDFITINAPSQQFGDRARTQFGRQGEH